MKILVVDNDQNQCDRIKVFLERPQYSHTVFTETDGAKTLKCIDELSPSIVILDVDLDSTDYTGWTICFDISNLPAYKNNSLAVVMISLPFKKVADEITGLRMGADVFIPKPFKRAKLAACIEALGRRQKGEAKKKIYIDSKLVIDTEKKVVLYENKPISLKKMEFEVLQYLSLQLDIPVSKTELINAVCRSREIEEGGIAKHICNIRKEFESFTAHQYIETVHGVGYKIVQLRDN